MKSKASPKKRIRKSKAESPEEGEIVTKAKLSLISHKENIKDAKNSFNQAQELVRSIETLKEPF
jgi:hypothetical protein